MDFSMDARLMLLLSLDKARSSALGKRRVMALKDLQTKQRSQRVTARPRFYSAANLNQASKPCLSAR